MGGALQKGREIQKEPALLTEHPAEIIPRSGGDRSQSNVIMPGSPVHTLTEGAVTPARIDAGLLSAFSDPAHGFFLYGKAQRNHHFGKRQKVPVPGWILNCLCPRQRG